MAVPEITDKNIINSNAWVQTAFNIGELEDTAPINLESLKKSLPEIRKMTLDASTLFLPKLKQILGESGVAFVVIPNLRNCDINGAVKWLGKDKVLLVMNDRSKYTDSFWFKFFHEINHVFLTKKGAYNLIH